MPRIIVVEDDPGIARLLSTLLRLDGYEVRQATDWVTLESAVEQCRPDLIIIDVHLREGSGWELLRRVRAQPDAANADIPVLMMSGMADCREMWKRAGADGFLEKPFDRAQLLIAIREIEAMRRRITPS